jgi:hypothetical protein
MLSKQTGWAIDDYAIALYTAACVYNSLHDTLSNLAGIQIASSAPIAGKSVPDGFAVGSPVQFVNLTNPNTVAVAILYRVSDSKLMAYMDTVSGFPFTPGGVTYTISPGGPGGSYFQL